MNAEIKQRPVVDQIFGDNKAPIEAVLSADFSDLKAEVDGLVARMLDAAKSQPKSDEDQAALGKFIIDARDLLKRADQKREVEKKPILDAGRALDAWFRDMLSALLKGRDHLQGMADTYARQKAAEARAKAEREAAEARAKAEEERAKAEAAKTPTGAARAEGRAEALDAKAEAAEGAVSAADADLVRARVDGVTASATGAWTARIDDYSAAIAPLGTLGIFLKEGDVQSALNSMAKTQKARAAWPGVVFLQETKATFRR
jgi:hypothetical protein